MNLGRPQVVLRPRTAGQMLALVTRLLQRRPLPLLAGWAVYSAGVLGYGALLIGHAGLQLPVAWALLVIGAPLLATPLVAIAGRLVFAEFVSPREIVVGVLRRWPDYALLLACLRLAQLVGTLALVVPGLFAWRWSWFLAPVVQLEGSGLRATLRRCRTFTAGELGRIAWQGASHAAVVGYWWAAVALFAHVLLVWVLGVNIARAAELAADPLYPHALALLGFAAARPLGTLLGFALYIDVRTRKEGWDLELALRAEAQAMERRPHGG